MLLINNMYAFNKQYSFRGSVLSIQRMRYSAGSIVAAFDANYMVKSGDEAFIHPSYKDDYSNWDVRRYRTWNVGLGGGYAYTWVINKRWLFAGLATVKLPLNFVKESYTNTTTDQYLTSGLNGNIWLRTSYERDNWSMSLHYINSRMLLGNEMFNPRVAGSYGMARLVFSKRFGINKKFKSVLKPLDAILDIPFHILKNKKSE